MKGLCLIFGFWLLAFTGFAQKTPAAIWADSVYKSLTTDQRIAQLMIVRLSSIDTKTKVITWYTDKVRDLVKSYNVGGILLFQGAPVKQANIINEMQSLAQTPIMVSIDGEWGLAMRMDSVQALPRQMMLGALRDKSLIYEYGRLVGAQCKRMGIHMNYAPVVDVNNNPNNPVINDRSFGENKYKVAAYGVAYMRGMQDEGIMACAKHFPGHGDVATDSHYDLPVIMKTAAQLDSLELFPFKEMFEAGVASVMIAHLFIPSLDATPNQPTSISKKAVTNLMKSKMNFSGLTVTDALEMQGVKKFFPGAESSIRALIAGNDLLCLPDDIPNTIQQIRIAIKKKRLKMRDIEAHCKKVLEAKYNFVIQNASPVQTENLSADLNSGIASLRKRIAEKAITGAASSNSAFFPLRKTPDHELAVVTLGLRSGSSLAQKITSDYVADSFLFTPDEKITPQMLQQIRSHKKIIVDLHVTGRYAASEFGITASTKENLRLLNDSNSLAIVFGNPYALKFLCNWTNVIACYEDDEIVQQAAFELLKGDINFQGALPVSVCETFKEGTGLFIEPDKPPFKRSDRRKMAAAVIDSLMEEAIRERATPGAALLILQNGEVLYEKAYGYQTYDSAQAVTLHTVYDLASITKVAATTISIMKLYDEGSIHLDSTLALYLPETRRTNKGSITIRQLLLHEAGLEPVVLFYKRLLDSSGNISPSYGFNVRKNKTDLQLADSLFIDGAWKDSIYSMLLESKRNAAGKYVYSDNDFIFLAKIAERITGMSIADYADMNFYRPMGLRSMGFHPRDYLFRGQIAPTEFEAHFRDRMLSGFVHDPGAGMMGGIAGHAGLFSDVYDLAAVMQMLLQGGEWHGRKYLDSATVNLFTAYGSTVSRRGLGFDKAEKDNAVRKEAYPAIQASEKLFGHTGYTGTAVWADPASGLIVVFLSNRVHPLDNRKLLQLSTRTKVMEAAYRMAADSN